MPSPRSPLTIYGLSTKWLLSPQDGLPVPTAIGGGETVNVSGVLVFKTQRGELVTSTRPFATYDSVKLRGHMSKIERSVPEFHSPIQIHLQHPVELTEFKYLKCVQAGKSTTISGFVSKSREY